MRYFTLNEIFNSIISALIYGGIFEFICIFCSALYALAALFLALPVKAFFYKGRIFCTVYPEQYLADGKRVDIPLKLIASTLGVLLFSLGYLLLSYFALDGELRLYTLLIALLSGYALRVAVRPYVLRIFTFLLTRIFALLVILLRILTYPLRSLLIRIANTKIFTELRNKRSNALVKLKKLHLRSKRAAIEKRKKRRVSVE